MNGTPLPLRRRALAGLLALALAGAPMTPVQAQTPQQPSPQAQPMRLPALGESASDDFNLHAEKRLGEQIMREIRRDPDYIDDPALLEYLQTVWQPLVAAARARGDIGNDLDGLFPFESFLVRDRSVNAFALPGGYVGVHLGLMAITASPDELASVLGHELSHITQRHIARSITANSRNSTVGIAAMLLGLLVATRVNNPDVAQAAIVGGQAAVAQGQLNFSRDMEREADRNGIAIMSQAGYSPFGMASMFEKMDVANRINDTGGFPYLRSHPLTTERIGEAQQRAGAAGARPLAVVPIEHSLMQARARVLADGSTQALRRLQNLDTHNAVTPRERLVAQYTGALASLQLRDFERVDAALATARALAQSADPAARHALAALAADTALARGDAPAAALAIAPMADDASRSALLLRARVAMALHDPATLKASVESLQTWVAEHRRDATAWQALSASADASGQTLRSLRAAAEAQAAIGNLQGAIDRLRAGQQAARRSGSNTDFIEASVIDSRMRDLRAQQRELMAEQRANGNSRGGPRPEEPPQ